MNLHFQTILQKKGLIATGVVCLTAGVAIGYFLNRKDPEVIVEYLPAPKPKPERKIPPPVVIPADQHEAMKKNDLKIETNVPMSSVMDGGKFNYAAVSTPGIADADEPTKTDDDDDDEDNPVVRTETIEEHLERHSIFANTGDDWDYEVEKKLRKKGEPYTIHYDEFFEEDEDTFDFAQVSCTFYEGDAILVNNSDGVPIYNHPTIVGDMRFGHGSKDPNVVYIRNEKRKAEYEIIREEGAYAHEVMGLDEDNDRTRNIRHSQSRTPKFRQE